MREKRFCLAGLGIGGARDTRRVESLLVVVGEREIGPIEAGGGFGGCVSSHRAALALGLWISLPCIWAGKRLMDVIGLDYGGFCSVCWIRYQGGLEHMN